MSTTTERPPTLSDGDVEYKMTGPRTAELHQIGYEDKSLIGVLTVPDRVPDHKAEAAVRRVASLLTAGLHFAEHYERQTRTLAKVARHAMSGELTRPF